MVTLITALVSTSCAQSKGDSIEIVKVFGGYHFYQHDKRLNMRELVKIMEPNEVAFKHIKSAQSNNTMATIVGAIGGFLVGWPVGTALGGGDPNWTMAAIGGGLIVVSIPIITKANKQSRLAIAAYNEGLKTTSFNVKHQISPGIASKRIGFTLSF